MSTAANNQRAGPTNGGAGAAGAAYAVVEIGSTSPQPPRTNTLELGTIATGLPGQPMSDQDPRRSSGGAAGVAAVTERRAGTTVGGSTFRASATAPGQDQGSIGGGGAAGGQDGESLTAPISRNSNSGTENDKAVASATSLLQRFMIVSTVLNVVFYGVLLYFISAQSVSINNFYNRQVPLYVIK